jgi:hypothetical protein
MTCPKCNSDVPATARFCAQCGQPINEPYSPPSNTPVWVYLLIIVVVVFVGYVVYRVVNYGANISCPVTDISKVAASNQYVPPEPPPPQPHVGPITNGALTVGANAYSWYTFAVPVGATNVNVTGRFTATGGTGNDIIVYILDEDGFVNFKNGHATPTYYNSGQVTQAEIQGVLPNSPGTYY